MNIENAKKIKLPNVTYRQAEQIMEILKKKRIERKEKKDLDTSIDNQSQYDINLRALETSVIFSQDKNLQGTKITTHDRFCLTNLLKRICCCFKSYNVMNDTTMTTEK